MNPILRLPPQDDEQEISIEAEMLRNMCDKLRFIALNKAIPFVQGELTHLSNNQFVFATGL